ncbi:hypothetical protein GlitD10_2302, partial [Gloeomargarita lithophora Alchichica-D10]
MAENLPALIQQMQGAGFYPHPVGVIGVKQTHISWVMLTGDFAYKVKKPANFGFLDFSTLAKRQQFCQEELRLNQRLAPELYLDVLPISINAQGEYGFNSAGEIVEYAVKMRQFGEDDLWLTCFEQGKLAVQDLENLGAQIAQFHQQSPTNEYITGFGSLAMIKRVVDSNYEATESYTNEWGLAKEFQAIRGFTDNYLIKHQDWFSERQNLGKIRECHGDLHLGNICFFQGQACVFDCIEFNEEFRLTDGVYDVAFLVMD